MENKIFNAPYQNSYQSKDNFLLLYKLLKRIATTLSWISIWLFIIALYSCTIGSFACGK
ncbi:MAG: hypothetical protein NC222_06345 [Staphylococcus sp.]|nr:hypothetical protein [Staphylococcus sp.]